MTNLPSITSSPAATLEQLYQQNAQLEAKAASVLNTSNASMVTTGRGTATRDIDQQWSKDLVEFLGISVLIFGIVAMLLMFVLFLRNRNNEILLRAFGIPLIIVSAVFLIVAGYTEKQIAPVMGLLGTIAGYLLAKTEPRSNDQTPSPKTPPKD